MFNCYLIVSLYSFINLSLIVILTDFVLCSCARGKKARGLLKRNLNIVCAPFKRNLNMMLYHGINGIHGLNSIQGMNGSNGMNGH